MMNFAEYENRLIHLLKDAGVNDFDIDRSNNHQLILTLKSPCAEIDALRVYVSADEVMLSCKATHTHITAGDAKSESIDLIALAAQEVLDFVQDRIAVSIEFSPAGEVVSSGWCPAEFIGDVSPGYAELMESLYGGPCRTVYWFWSGKSVAL